MPHMRSWQCWNLPLSFSGSNSLVLRERGFHLHINPPTSTCICWPPLLWAQDAGSDADPLPAALQEVERLHREVEVANEVREVFGYGEQR